MDVGRTYHIKHHTRGEFVARVVSEENAYRFVELVEGTPRCSEFEFGCKKGHFKPGDKFWLRTEFCQAKEYGYDPNQIPGDDGTPVDDSPSHCATESQGPDGE